MKRKSKVMKVNLGLVIFLFNNTKGDFGKFNDLLVNIEFFCDINNNYLYRRRYNEPSYIY